MTLIDNEAAAFRTGGDEPATFRTIYRAPIGEILLVADEDGLREVRLPGPGTDGDRPPAGAATCAPLEEAVEQLQAYFAGELTNFDLPLVLTGTAFQRRVWRALADIPYGHTESYGSVATRVGNPKASRAVGMANNKNPLPIVLPCHRVIGANGKLVGYGGGLWMKEWLLGHEASSRRTGRVIAPLNARARPAGTVVSDGGRSWHGGISPGSVGAQGSVRSARRMRPRRAHPL